MKHRDKSNKTVYLPLLAAAAASMLVTPTAFAGKLDMGDTELKVNWDNTFKYSAAWRLKDPNQTIAASATNPNVDFGDLGHDKGLINNRFDLLSELDVSYKNLGMRVSGAAWYDNEYDKKDNDYAGSAPNNQRQLASGRFNQTNAASRKVMAHKAELADAFVFGKFALTDEQNLTVRAGRHTLLFGETLFLGANGIAAAQGPVDLVKLFSLPNSQFKEIAIPVNQVSANVQLSPGVSLSGYSQYEWRSLRIPSSGSYFSMADFAGDGGDLLLNPVNGAATRGNDFKGRNSGQYGLQLKFKGGSVDYGLYAARYDDKAPIFVLNAATGQYNAMYSQGVRTYGASASTVIGETNVAVEMSTRRNTPLTVIGDLFITTDPHANNDGNTPYARGNSFHTNVSSITVLPGTSVWDGASFVGELAFNRLLSVTHDPISGVTGLPALNSTHTRDATAMRFVFQPEYFQVFPGVDLQVPIGVGYGINGRSAIFQASPEHGGDLSIGINADYMKTWRANINFVHYYGAKGPAPAVGVAAGTYASYKQYYGDRDYISFSLQRTF
ncbi:DUF1302 domain-containing protein [Duganella sp. Dugasp56]|uniref:DUF1302 domain-containing protein n=1 Tax=Duganella sp. Dugasp56 TaxID=3243046 RepID=UPI0039B06AF3